MRKVTYGGAVSLDGFLAGPGGNVDWLHFSKDVLEVMAESWKGVDTVLMGRKTWTASLALGGGELAQSLLGAGLVDEVGLNIHPLLLGAGVPVFRDPGHRVKLTLTECRSIDGGCVLATYRVA